MFIVFGVSEKILGDYKLSSPCPSCKTSGLIGTFIQRYFNIMWIPMWPTSKYAYVTCENCGGVFDPSRLPGVMEELASIMPKTPKWTFSGLAIIVLLALSVVVAAIFDISGSGDGRKSYYEDPQKDDVYVVDSMDLRGPMVFEGKKYSLLKVLDLKAEEGAETTYLLVDYKMASVEAAKDFIALGGLEQPQEVNVTLKGLPVDAKILAIIRPSDLLAGKGGTQLLEGSE